MVEGGKPSIRLFGPNQWSKPAQQKTVPMAPDSHVWLVARWSRLTGRQDGSSSKWNQRETGAWVDGTKNICSVSRLVASAVAAHGRRGVGVRYDRVATDLQ